MGPGIRASRIDQLVKQLIRKKSGKIVAADMIDILNDSRDIVAAKNKVIVEKITRKYIQSIHNDNSTEKILDILDKIKDWKGDFEIGKSLVTLLFRFGRTHLLYCLDEEYLEISSY